MNNEGTNYYRWSNGQTNAPLAPSAAGDGFQATDIDANGRVVGLETITPLPSGYDTYMHNPTDMQLDVWAPGATTAALTTAPLIGFDGQPPGQGGQNGNYATGYGDGSGSNGAGRAIILGNDCSDVPLASPGDIWSSQCVYVAEAWFAYSGGDIMLSDGFQNGTELGGFTMVTGTNSTGNCSGTNVTVLASNDSNQALLENDSGFQSYQGTTNDPLIWHATTTTYTLGGVTVPISPALLGPTAWPINWFTQVTWTYNGGVSLVPSPYWVYSAGTTQGILSNVSALGKSYVLGSNIALSWNSIGAPVYTAITKYYCWDARTR